MEKEILENYEKAKKISDEVIEFAKRLPKENLKVLDIAEQVESKIRELGGKPSWPVNISINELAAHYTPDVNDTTVLKVGELVKLDIGVQVNVYIWDRAFTVCIGSKTHPLVEASEKALEEALKLIKPGVKVCEISEVVENTIASFGFNPVRNLCGHGLEQYNQHAEPSIPNGKNNIQAELKSGTAIAMETFATDGVGFVKESRPSLIFRFREDKPVRLWEARQILEKSQKEFDELPFCKRWFKTISPIKFDMAIKQLLEIEAVDSYPPLKEESNGLVAQSEETIILK